MKRRRKEREQEKCMREREHIFLGFSPFTSFYLTFFYDKQCSLVTSLSPPHLLHCGLLEDGEGRIRPQHIDVDLGGKNQKKVDERRRMGTKKAVQGIAKERERERERKKEKGREEERELERKRERERERTREEERGRERMREKE